MELVLDAMELVVDAGRGSGHAYLDANACGRVPRRLTARNMTPHGRAAEPLFDRTCMQTSAVFAPLSGPPKTGVLIASLQRSSYRFHRDHSHLGSVAIWDQVFFDSNRRPADRMATSETHDPAEVYLLHMAEILDKQAATQEFTLSFLHNEILDAMAKEDSPSQLLAECSKGCGRSAAPGWKTCCRRCSDGKTPHGRFCRTEPFRLLMFGSRRYGAALPSSDIDLVLELKLDDSLDKEQQNAQIYALLDYLYARFGHADRITELQNMNAWKSTLSFRIATPVYNYSMKVDLTCCMGPAEHNHRPSLVTECIKRMLSGLDDGGRAMVRLTVDCMKRNHLCWNGKGALGALRDSLAERV